MAWSPLGGPETFDAVDVGYVIAPADVALWDPSADLAAGGPGAVKAIVVAPEAEAAMLQVDRAVARAGCGLKGDRYFDERGTFSKPTGAGTTSR